MAFLKRNFLDIKKEKELETANATIQEQGALLQYIAIMADIELPEEEGGDANEQDGVEN